MYISISFDGRISTGGYPSTHVEGNIYLDSYGRIVLEIYDSGSPYYYDDSYEDSRYELGKIKRIGSTYFSYYCDSYEDSSYELGKISRIGNTYIYYYCDSYEDHSYELGKVKRIGDYYFYYDEDGSCRISRY